MTTTQIVTMIEGDQIIIAEPSKKVTPAQIKFLQLLHEHGPMTAFELAGGVGKSIQYAHQVIRELREEEIIEKTLEGIDTSVTRKHLAWKYKLTVPIESISIRARISPPHKILDEEIRYAAILRNAPPECGMTGQDLQNQFRAMYPHRSGGTLRLRIIPKARQKKWCL